MVTSTALNAEDASFTSSPALQTELPATTGVADAALAQWCFPHRGGLPPARNEVRVGWRSPPRARRKKAVLEPSTDLARFSALSSIGYRIATTRCPNKHAPPPALPLAVRTIAPVDRNWHVKIGVNALPPEVLPVGRPLRVPPAHSKHWTESEDSCALA